MKKNIIFAVIFCCLVTVIGQFCKSGFRNIGLNEVNNVEQLQGYKLAFESVEGTEEVTYYKEQKKHYLDKYAEAEDILIVEPTGKCVIGAEGSQQEVLVKKVIKGKKQLVDESIWIDGILSVAYNEKEKGIRIDGYLNFMQKNNQYLVFCDPYGVYKIEGKEDCSKYYHSDCFFGHLNITKQDIAFRTIKANQDYKMQDLSKYEMWGKDEALKKIKQEIKDALIERYVTA